MVGRDGKDGRNWVKATFKVSPFPLTVFDFASTSPIDANDSALLSGVFPAWNAQPCRTDQRFFHVTLLCAMQRFSWNAVNVAYRVEKNLGTTLTIILSHIFSKICR